MIDESSKDRPLNENGQAPGTDGSDNEPIRGREFDVNSVNVSDAPVVREVRPTGRSDRSEPSFVSYEDEEDNRSRLTIFFQVLGRKFWKLINLNLLTGIFNIPAVAFMLILAMYLLQLLSPNVLAEASTDILSYLLIVFVPILLVFTSIPAVTLGPAQAGISYLLRNWSYETPTFLWWDFKEKARENLKQSLIVGSINTGVFILAVLDLYLYSKLATGNLLLTAASSLLILLFVIFLMMCMYIWPMMVSYKLTVKQLYRNAFLFAIGRFFPNLLMLILMLVFSYGPFLVAGLFGNVLGYLVAYVYYLLLGLSLPGLVMNFIVNPILDKHMQPEEEAEEKAE